MVDARRASVVLIERVRNRGVPLPPGLLTLSVKWSAGPEHYLRNMLRRSWGMEGYATQRE